MRALKRYAILDPMKKSSSGFTIVELLIVIVVIGILAAITIVAYNGIQSRAYENSVRLDLQNTGKVLNLFKVDEGSWPQNTESGLQRVKLSVSQSPYDTSLGNYLYCGSAATADYALVAVAKNGKTYAYGSSRAFSEYTTYTIGDYPNVCTNLTGAAGARYGYTNADGWRLWTRNS